MSPEAQRIAIAEACGWTKCEEYSPTGDVIDYRGNRKGTPLGCWAKLPDYLSDLNAMHEAEKVLTPAQAEEFMRFLWDGVKDTCPNYIKLAAYVMAHATAAQRAEAFLRTLGKWEDGK